ncbi:MAG: hypothetical protein K2L42_00290 [Clostridia bacterium]|nr:hypothetical protein [Clostridia bacterium]
MAQKLLDFIAGSDGNWYFENRFSEGAIYALIGFAIVFIGIALIILIIWLEGLLMRKTNNLAFMGAFGRKVKAAFAKVFKRKKKTIEVPQAQTAISTEEAIPDEVKAAIIAAIMAYYSQELPKCEFKVKRIKRI